MSTLVRSENVKAASAPAAVDEEDDVEFRAFFFLISVCSSGRPFSLALPLSAGSLSTFCFLFFDRLILGGRTVVMTGAAPNMLTVRS